MSAPSPTFHLHPEGNDLADGSSSTPRKRSRKGPWKTLAGARDALRRMREEGTLQGPVSVQVHSGRYDLEDSVHFGPEDGSTRYFAEPGEVAIFDGGEILTGWVESQVDGLRRWTLKLPEGDGLRRRFRSLFVNDGRRPRARWPKFSADAKGVKNVFRIGEIRFPEHRGLFAGDHVFKPREGDFEEWPSLGDAEVVLLHYWIETRLGTPRYNPENGWVECSRRSVFNLYESFNPRLARYYIDNLQEALSEPGEWYLDRTQDTIVYLPKEGETLENTTLVAPRLTQFIEVAGRTFGQTPELWHPEDLEAVKDLHFEGLHFVHGDWYQPPADVPPQNQQQVGVQDVPLGSAAQAAVNVPGVIRFEWAHRCSLTRCSIRRIGFSAAELGRGCQQCSITHCTFEDLGAGGIKVGGAELDGRPVDRTGHLRIEDNRITDLGRVFHQGVGILLTHAYSTRVRHNEVARGCYTGISCGWSWGYGRTISRDNLIENNYLHDLGQGVLSDMGAIYLLGVQPGTIVRGNHIHTVTSADYGGWGIYPDEGCSHMLFEHNWVHDTQGAAFRIHFARELIVRQNVFARAQTEGVIGLGRGEDHVAATFSQNLLLGPAPAMVEGGYRGDVTQSFRSDGNLVHFPGFPKCAVRHALDRHDKPRQITWKQWQRTGHDLRSIAEDPRLREDVCSLRLAATSPAKAIGFKSWNWAQCGPRTANA